MIYSTLCGNRVSRLGFGCMRFPTNEEGTIDRAASRAMLDRAYREGVNYFDTAYGYHDGESELFTGEVLKDYPRDSFYLATKLPTWFLKTEEDPPRLFEEQLQKLQVEYFDYYLVHNLNTQFWANTRKTGALAYLAEQKAAGKIGKLGFSYHGIDTLFDEILDAFDWDFVQIQINYLDYVMTDAKSFHDKLTSRGISCIVMEPVRGGYLANPAGKALEAIRRCGEGSPASWALRWCLHQENMPLILSGMSSMEQVEDNLNTFREERSLTKEQLDAIRQAGEAFLETLKVPCTACRYCMPCSFGVDIPWVFDLYNSIPVRSDREQIKKGYNMFPSRADKCTACGACVSQCPQNIAIPERLTEAHQALLAL